MNTIEEQIRDLEKQIFELTDLLELFIETQGYTVSRDQSDYGGIRYKLTKKEE